MRRLIAVGFELVAALLDPRAWLHWLRLARYSYLFHVTQRGRLRRAGPVRISPTADFRNAERIEVGSGTRIGERCSLWAGDDAGRIVIGGGCLLAPYVFVTASDYGLQPDRRILAQPKREADVHIGDDVWLGAYVTVTAGVSIGDGTVVGAGAVVTRSLPAGAIAAGVPAKVVGWRKKAAMSEELS
jgi:acetyltransferase-like isoleucine patch superfamily enzyme